MSKLYDKFSSLKNTNNEKLYLFKSGIFFIALNEDAKKLSDIFGFKITNLNDAVTKCGFPSKRIDYYSSLLNKMDVDFDIIDFSTTSAKSTKDYINSYNFDDIIDLLINIDFNNITFKEAFETLYDLSNRTKKILDNSEK